MLKKYFLKGLLAVTILNVGGCFGTINGETSNTYLLNSIPAVNTAKPKPLILTIKMPQANPAYNTTQMAYITEAYKISYYTRNSWAATPPQMILPLMIQTLQNTHAFRAVIPQSAYGHADLILDTQLIQLQQDFTQSPDQVHLVIRAQLSNVSNQHILATRDFNITEPMDSKNPYAGAAATNRAINQFLQQLVEFVLANASNK